MTTRVGITGIGLITPLGNDTASTWEAARAGRSGVAEITRFDSSRHGVHIAAEVKDFDPLDYMDRKEARRNDRFVHYAMAAAKQALADSGLEITDELADDVGVIIGSGIGGLHDLSRPVQDTLRPWAGSRQPVLHHAVHDRRSPPASSRWLSARAARTSPPSRPARRAPARSARRSR